MSGERCETCKHWNRLDYVVPVPGPSEWGTCELIGRFEADGSDRAYTSDASDYSSWLTTRADFGCVEHEAR